MDTKQFMERVKELEQIEKKYIQLKDFVSTEVVSIQEKLEDISLILKNINPILSTISTKKLVRKSGKKLTDIAMKIYQDLVDDTKSYVSYTSMKSEYEISGDSLMKIISILKSCPGIQMRKNFRDSKIKEYYYQKPNTLIIGDFVNKTIKEKLVEKENIKIL